MAATLYRFERQVDTRSWCMADVLVDILKSLIATEDKIYKNLQEGQFQRALNSIIWSLGFIQYQIHNRKIEIQQ